MQKASLMKIALSAFILLWSFAGWTADGGAMNVEKKQTEPAKPSVVKSGNDYFIDFKDGRIAGFFQEVGKTSQSRRQNPLLNTGFASPSFQARTKTFSES